MLPPRAGATHVMPSTEIYARNPPQRATGPERPVAVEGHGLGAGEDSRARENERRNPVFRGPRG